MDRPERRSVPRPVNYGIAWWNESDVFGDSPSSTPEQDVLGPSADPFAVGLSNSEEEECEWGSNVSSDTDSEVEFSMEASDSDGWDTSLESETMNNETSAQECTSKRAGKRRRRSNSEEQSRERSNRPADTLNLGGARRLEESESKAGNEDIKMGVASDIYLSSESGVGTSHSEALV